MLRTGIFAAPLLLVLAGCDGQTPTPRDADMGVINAGPVTNLPGQPDVAMARQACGRQLAGPDGMMQVEFARPSGTGAVVMLHVQPQEGGPRTERWRCYFDYETRRLRAVPA